MIFFENIVVIIKCTSSGFVTYNHTLIFMIGSHTAIHIVSQGINMRGIFKLWLKIIRKMSLNEIFQQDTSKLAMSYVIRKSMLFFFFIFDFMQLYNYTLNVLVNQQVAWNQKKNKKNTWVFFYIKYRKFWSILLVDFVERKPLLFEEGMCE